MQKFQKMLSVLLPLSVFLLFSACNVSGAGTQNNNISPTPTLPSLLPEVARGYQVVANSSCLVAQYTPITTDKAQGDLMAWQPDSHNLAYVSPLNNSWAWYLGRLVIANPIESKTVFEDANLRVFGDLHWSPDGSSLAFITLQTSDFYDAMLIQPDSGQSVDLFPGLEAQTDDLAGKKAIAEWLNNRQLTVTASCGIDCMQIYQFNRDGSGKQVVKEIRPVEDHSYELTFNRIKYDETTYPAMIAPNWSPDDSQVFYTDEDDLAWVLDVPAKTQYQLGWLGDYVRETKWSSDSQFVAVRMDNKINIYKTKCK